MPERCILMVEDEVCLAMMLEDLLVDAGFEVLRAARLDEGLRLAGSEHIDAAILDINLDGEAVYPLAAVLHAQHVPFLFASAYGHPGIPEEFRGYTMLTKPYPPASVVPAVERLLASREMGKPAPATQHPQAISTPRSASGH